MQLYMGCVRLSLEADTTKLSCNLECGFMCQDSRHCTQIAMYTIGCLAAGARFIWPAADTSEQYPVLQWMAHGAAWWLHVVC